MSDHNHYFKRSAKTDTVTKCACGAVRPYTPHAFAYRFFREHAGYIVGRAAECALRLARAEARAESDGLTFEVRDDDDTGAGEFCTGHGHLVVILRDPTDGKALDSVGGVCSNHTRESMHVIMAELAQSYYVKDRKNVSS